METIRKNAAEVKDNVRWQHKEEETKRQGKTQKLWGNKVDEHENNVKKNPMTKKEDEPKRFLIHTYSD